AEGDQRLLRSDGRGLRRGDRQARPLRRRHGRTADGHPRRDRNGAGGRVDGPHRPARHRRSSRDHRVRRSLLFVHLPVVHARARRHGGLGPRHAFAVAGLVFAWTFTTFVLVGPYARELFGRVWFPVLVAHVVGVGFTARLLYDVQDQARLGAERARFRAI